MSYNKFKEEIWAEEIQRGNERKSTFAKTCYKNYEGEIKGLGDSVFIKGIISPTVSLKTIKDDDKFSDPEVVKDVDQKMTIDKYTEFNFRVGDIDKAQMKGDLKSAYMDEASLKSGNKIDIAVAEMAKDTQAMKLNGNTPVKVTTDNVLDMIDSALVKLFENDVPPNDEIFLTVTPRFQKILKTKIQSLDTNNSQLIKDGFFAAYSGAKIDMSNNIVKADSDATDLIMLRTGKAIALANPYTDVEPYVHSYYKGDCVRGRSLFGVKLIRPQELVVINCKYA